MSISSWSSPIPHRHLLILSALALVLAACRTAAPAEDDPVVDVEEEVRAEEAVADVEWHSGLPVDDQALWVLELLNDRDGAMTEEEMDERFGDEIHEALGYEQFLPALTQIAAMGPFTAGPAAERPADEVLVLPVQDGGGTALLMSVVVESEEPHKIRGLNFTPAPDEANVPTTWDEVTDGLAALGGTATLFAGRISGGECIPSQQVHSDANLAVGSTFKYYVLARLAEAVAAGDVSYDDDIIIDDALKSLPSGVLQDQEAGTTVSVLDAASKMISISDNTATDHLLALLGRSAVEEGMNRFGHSAPESTLPFLFTHEFMRLKLAVDDTTRDDYAGRDAEGRRALLTEAIHPLDLPALSSAQSWTAPRHIESIEWFASAEDLCALHAFLIDHAEDPAFTQALEVLAINNGGIDAEGLSYVGYKGGSEPGVVNLSWLLRDDAGDWHSLTVGVNHPDDAVPVSAVHDIARGAARLLFGQ